jgi:hypothetical protein
MEIPIVSFYEEHTLLKKSAAVWNCKLNVSECSELLFIDKNYFVKSNRKYIDFVDYILQLVDFLLFILVFIFRHKILAFRQFRIFLKVKQTSNNPISRQQ